MDPMGLELSSSLRDYKSSSDKAAHFRLVDFFHKFPKGGALCDSYMFPSSSRLRVGSHWNSVHGFPQKSVAGRIQGIQVHEVVLKRPWQTLVSTKPGFGASLS